MSRKPRFALPRIPQHVIQRGHNREPCFYAEGDYSRYCQNLREAAERNNARIHAYVLMTNHVHLLVTPGYPHSISHLMQDLGRKFVRYINHTYRRTGGLWEGRFKASLVDSEAYLLTCMRYIELNPMRPGMVVHPGDYRWSSYAARERPTRLSINISPALPEAGKHRGTAPVCVPRVIPCAAGRIRDSCRSRGAEPRAGAG